MSRPRSLRYRVLLGAVLWTAGLAAIVNVVATAVVLHRHFSTVLMAHGGLLIVLAVTCMIAGFAQVKQALSSLTLLRQSLLAVREGRARSVVGRYPSEVHPLVDDLNALLDNRERAVSRAVARAGDLAHGLKTPLALLSQEAGRAASQGQGELAAAVRQHVDRMARQVDYHLAQARAAASGSVPGTWCVVAESVEALSRTLQHLHADRQLSVESRVEAWHGVRVQREDLDEMLGNLLDNAYKWARSRIEMASTESGGLVAIAVDDDGPGVAESMRGAVLQRGVRADEAAPGSGLGLAIVRDLAEVYGGTISLDVSHLGGLRAVLRLPATAMLERREATAANAERRERS